MLMQHAHGGCTGGATQSDPTTETIGSLDRNGAPGAGRASNSERGFGSQKGPGASPGDQTASNMSGGRCNEAVELSELQVALQNEQSGR